jgi:hypothetical protein
MNNDSTQGILTTKKFAVNPHFPFCCLLYSPVDVSDKTPAAVSQNIWTPFSIVPLFHFGNVLVEI